MGPKIVQAIADAPGIVSPSLVAYFCSRASINVTGPAGRWTTQQMEHHLQELPDEVGQVSAQLGYRPA